jgi:hypothetical protein
VTASNFAPHGKFAHALAMSVPPLVEIGQKIEFNVFQQYKVGDLNFLSNFHSFHFSLGRVFMLASLLEKGCKVRGFYGIV